MSYGNRSTWGSTTTCKNGFKQQYTTTVSATGVYVGHLKDPSQMPSGVAQRLAYYGITTADHAEILEADPYAYGPVPVSSP